MPSTQTSFWNIFFRYKVHHVLLWLGYFVFWSFFYYKYYDSLFMLIGVIAIYGSFNATAFYGIAYFLFPRYLYKNKIGLFIFWTAVLVSILTAILAVVLMRIYHLVGKGEYDITYGNALQQAFMTIMTITGLLGGIKLVAEKIRSGREERQREQQRVESELQFLKAQVNPHFLFNAINSIYFLIKKDPDKAADTLIQLSDLLRFQLYDCSEEKIPIDKELEYLGNFIKLEQLRKGEKVKVLFELQEGIAGFQIAPFILMPFIENAFKHVSIFNGGDNHVRIRFERQNDVFHSYVENTTDNLVKYEVGGIGLKNVKRRLELLYPHKHDLTIRDDNGKYIVHLALTIA